MDQLPEKRKEDIKKISTSRIQLKLSRGGYTDEEIESFDRQTCMMKLAELMVRSIKVDEPLATAPQPPIVDIEFERERLEWERQKFAEEMKLGMPMSWKFKKI